TAADEPASLLRDDSQGETFPAVSGLEVGHDMENIIKTSALPHDLTPRVTSLDTDEGKLSGDDAPIKRRSLETGEEAGVEKCTERGNTPKKKKLQEQIDVQVAREIEEQIAREDQRRNEQITRDAKIARIHAVKELKMMIDGLDRSNEVIVRHLHEYEKS
nr:hypothetical protein [Tanacetum cinerariifolium]